MTTRIVLSGITGVLGSELVKLLTAEFGERCELVGVFRTRRSRDAFLEKSDHAVRPVVCDLTIGEQVRRACSELPAATKVLGIHAAADVAWHKSAADLHGPNVEGTLNFARLLRATSGRWARLVYVSSAYTRDKDWDYRNGYEETKALAEREVKAGFPELDPTTFSCSLIVGHSRSGEIAAFHGVYPLLRLIDYLEPPFLVGSRRGLIDLVPVDWVARQLLELCRRVSRSGRSEEVVASSGAERSVTLPDLIELVCGTLNEHRRQTAAAELADIPVLSFRQWDFLRRSIEIWGVREIDPSDFAYLERLLESYRPYLEDSRVRAPRNVSGLPPHPREYMHHVVRYWLSRMQGRRRRTPSWQAAAGS